MAKLGFDYDTAKALYLKGLSLRQISDRTGINYDALSKTCQRKKWDNLRTQSVQLLSDHVQGKLAEHATRHLLDVSELAAQAIATLRAKPLNEMPMDDLQRLASIADTFDRIARRTYRLDEQEHPQLHVHLDLHAAQGARNPHGIQPEKRAKAQVIATEPVAPEGG